MPTTVSQLKYELPNLVATVLEDQPAKGVIMTGFGDPSMEHDALRHATLENVTARDILLQAITEGPTFCVIVVFDRVTPTKEQALKADWIWQSFHVDLRPVYANGSHKSE